MDLVRRLTIGMKNQVVFGLQTKSSFAGKSLRGSGWTRFAYGQQGINRSSAFALGLSGIFVPLTVSAWGLAKPKVDTKGINLRKDDDSELLEAILACNDMYTKGELLTKNDEIYEQLNKHREKEEPELLWRLARSSYERSKQIKDFNQRKDAVEEAYNLAKKALELDETNFAAHKWVAVLLNELSKMRGTKEQITQAFNVKYHMERAAELNPKDPTSAYLVGQWCFSVSEVPWYQQKIASAIFATPPTSTYEEALVYFLRAEDIQPLFYSMNLLMLAKTYVKLGHPEKAREYLKKLGDLPIKTDEDFVARREGKEILDKLPKIPEVSTNAKDASKPKMAQL